MSITDNWNAVYAEVEDFCMEHALDMPVIVAISKTKSSEQILEAVDAGARHIGESYPQELAEKAESISDDRISWHFVGHLQRRNAKYVVETADVIHAVDSIKLYNRLDHFNYSGETFIQFNISKESSKYGLETYDSLAKVFHHSQQLQQPAVGVMTIGDPNWDQQTTISKFSELYQRASEIFKTKPLYSAGMTNDWRQALVAGATHLRIGSAIFGARNK